MARLIRAQVLSLKQREFVIAKRAIRYITYENYIWAFNLNLTGIIIVNLSFTIPALFFRIILSFIGLGVQSPAASWGR